MFVGRKKELDLLHADLESKKNTAIMIYGRRRIGNGKKHYSEIEARIS